MAAGARPVKRTQAQVTPCSGSQSQVMPRSGSLVKSRSGSQPQVTPRRGSQAKGRAVKRQKHGAGARNADPSAGEDMIESRVIVDRTWRR